MDSTASSGTVVDAFDGLSPSQRIARLEALLRQSRAETRRFRECFELGDAGQALIGLDGRFLEVNPALCAMTGYSREQLCQHTCMDITHSDDLETCRSAIRVLSQGVQSHFRTEKRYLHADGHVVHALVTLTLVRDAQGEVSHFVSMMQDITARKASERALVEREALLSSMGKFVPGIIHKVGFGPDGRARFLYISDRALEMFELPSEVMASDYYAHQVRVHPEDLAYAQRLGQPPKPGQSLHPVDFEYRVLLPTKGLRHYRGRALPVIEADGQVVWYGHTADVTDQKLLQEARVAVRAADDANRAKSEFLSRMSHELRTPLNAVIGFAQLLRLDRKQPLADTQRNKVDLIERAGAHLLEVISDVLDLSRIEVGGLPLTLEPVPARQVMDEALNLVESMAREAGIRLISEIGPSEWRAQADRLRLRQILVNLLSNAIKYNNPGGQVTVRVHQPGDGLLGLEVEDTGIGMTPGQQAHLFESFNRLGAERSGIEGTGIGLVIVHRLVDLMHGRIDVHSQAGAGSRFTVWLPTACEGEAGEASQPAAGLPLEAPRAGLSVLYAEDNEVNIDLVRKVLELRPACRLVVARSGAEALALAAAARPGLLLLDMHLGDMDGFELLRRLAAIPTLTGVPRVAFSADAMSEQIDKAKASGFTAYLTKPLDVVALLRCVDEHTGVAGMA